MTSFSNTFPRTLTDWQRFAAIMCQRNGGSIEITEDEVVSADFSGELVATYTPYDGRTVVRWKHVDRKHLFTDVDVTDFSTG